MYEWIPQKTNNTARQLICILFAGAAVLMLFTVALPQIPYRWAIQLIALILLTAAIFMITRYVSKIFIYRIVKDEAGRLDLTVTEARANGKNQITVCRVGLTNIRQRILLDMEKPEEAEKRLSELKKEKKKIFDYCVDFRPAKSCLLIVEEGGEDLAIRLSYDPAWFDIFAPCRQESAE